MDDMQGNTPMGEEQQAQGGYCIEIYVGADGKPTSVNVESQDEEDGEDQGMQSAMGGAQDDQSESQGGDKGVPVASMEEAMSMVHEIIQNQGQMPQGGSNDRESIARKVFGDQIVDKQMPGELNRKGRSGY